MCATMPILSVFMTVSLLNMACLMTTSYANTGTPPKKMEDILLDKESTHNEKIDQLTTLGRENISILRDHPRNRREDWFLIIPAMGKTKSRQYTPVLLEWLDVDDMRQILALEALKEIADEDAEPRVLREFMNKDNPISVRLCAAEALALFGSRSARKTIEQFIINTNAVIASHQQTCVKGGERFGGDDAEHWWRALVALRSDNCVKTLAMSFEELNFLVNEESILMDLLTSSGVSDARLARALMGICNDSRKDPYIRCRAANTLIETKMHNLVPDGLNAIHKMLDDPNLVPFMQWRKGRPDLNNDIEALLFVQGSRVQHGEK